ncbi:ABC transporter ATP-binding protein [Saxibacter everestensis]|uniref:ABC transporter ATP-binding protein n=1 Tax=Saxibacter everestensis TaxID=2909229 RepID=A0ABY8QT06_9MICO|nr:ABC transporter ATP-binding protein [Brevibacteriaceae bacterium ZFBP1038]
MNADTAHLSIRGLRKTYPNTANPAVDDVNLDVDKGDLVALLGPSGCGKTTTLRMVAGLLAPTAGQIVVNGRNVVSTPVHKRGMGMVFQSYALFPHMNIAENVAFGLQMRKMPKAATKKKVTETLDMVQLGHLRARRPSELSGGQQQRVALARALVIEPTLLLLDEPLSNLDAKLREAMRHEIRAIQKRSGTTTLFVTHDQDEALDMADRIAILNNGVIEQYAAPTEVYDRPATRFVAHFVGKANFLDVTGATASAPDRYRVMTPSFGTLEVPGVRGLDLSKASLVVRPHRIAAARVTETTGDDLPNGIGEVIETSYTGNVQSYSVQLTGGPVIRVDQLTDSVRGLRLGDSARISFHPDEAYLVADR